MTSSVGYAPRVFDRTLDLTDAAVVCDLFDRAATALFESSHRRGSIVRLPGKGRLLATGDLHDNTIHLQKILAMAKLDASSDRHVILHELIHGENLINGMDFSHRMLAKVAGLVIEYPHQVHPLLANHELSQLTGRGVSKGAGNSVKLFNEALHYVFQDDWEVVAEAVNRFIRAMPLALLSDSGVWCSHSLPTVRSFAAGKFDPDIVDRDLVSEDYHYPDGNAYLMVWGRTHDRELFRALADCWNVRLFILGHQHAETGIEVKHVDPGCIVLNTDHERATVVEIDLANPPSEEEALMMAVPLASIAAEWEKSN